MAKIIIAKHFQKELYKIKTITIKNIVKEVKKYNRGLNNLIDIYSPAPNMKMLKGYLSGSKIRISVLLIVNNNIYIPCFIAKKESRNGYNLSKEISSKMLDRKVDLIMQDIANNNCFEIKL